MSKLAVTLWDFTWYTRTAPGEPFHDLDDAFAQAVERGYNTVRICAMPFLLFRSGLDTSALTFGGLGGEYGQRTRWYDVQAPATLDGRAHLLSFFRAAARHDCRVIVSSWEYQQSPAFLADDSWHRALRAVPVADRPLVLADAHADLIDLLKAEGLADTVAFVELHNEVQYSGLTQPGRFGQVLGLQDPLEAGIDRFKDRHPSVSCTVNYARVPVGELRAVPRNADVAVFHPYVYGVLDELVETFALRDTSRPYPQERAYAELLRDGAPPLEEWLPPADRRWILDATVVGRREVYTHDWCDPDKWDRWLYERYATYRVAMRQVLDTWLLAAADFAAARNVPLVFGEGWVGYTPLHGTFEEGPVGAEICAYAVRRSREVGAWGTVVCSNAAPHHPMWADVALQQRLNADFVR
ncbi:cellulase-like family protein [Cryptosporangium aurantiacum]|uniref:Sugar-binding cellulase-like n=1 Tax=Cryptosporangium aurantiacum TaxID=134849 RepID=A0A1M7QS89_9ACTN|nr:cellulase-like family protein [Cryptosporangium aurantiacum]SHN34507.1 Sugar-binding cellulase-like [Cryptosporangium aurantiacum]